MSSENRNNVGAAGTLSTGSISAVMHYCSCLDAAPHRHRVSLWIIRFLFRVGIVATYGRGVLSLMGFHATWMKLRNRLK